MIKYRKYLSRGGSYDIIIAVDNDEITSQWIRLRHTAYAYADPAIRGFYKQDPPFTNNMITGPATEYKEITKEEAFMEIL